MFFYKERNIIHKTLSEKQLGVLAQTKGIKVLIKYLVLAEDHRFYSHNGIDFIGVARAMYKDIFKGCHEGASTIDQQLVRVITNDNRCSLSRKIKEIILACWMDKKYTKKQIATCYLIIAYYGRRYPNLKSYLDQKGININEDLDDVTAANIIARLKYPEPAPFNQSSQYKINRRVEYILWLDKKYLRYDK